MGTFAEGLQTRVAFELPQRILAGHLDDFVLVSDDELRSATLRLLEITRNLIEPAGAAALAAALKLRDRLAGSRIALVCSGGNINPRQLYELLQWGNASSRRQGVMEPARRQRYTDRKQHKRPERHRSFVGSVTQLVPNWHSATHFCITHAL